MTELGFRPFDADHHYYEATDAFTRHMDPKMAKRAMQWAEVGGKQRLLVGGKVNKFIPSLVFQVFRHFLRNLINSLRSSRS